MSVSLSFPGKSETNARLLLGASVAAHELIYTACGVNQLALTGVEGVRGATDFQLEHGISLTFELNGFGCLGCGTAQKHVAVAHVLEYYRTIVFGMKSFFHCFVFCTPVFPVTGKQIRGGFMYSYFNLRLQR